VWRQGTAPRQAVRQDRQAGAGEKEDAGDEGAVAGRPDREVRVVSALPMAKVKVAITKQSPTSTAVFLVDVFVSPSSGHRSAAPACARVDGGGRCVVCWLFVQDGCVR
jgi:hypothetical protein